MRIRLFATSVSLGILFFLNCAQSIAQSKINGFEVEADPLAYILKGYSIHTAITYNKWRTSIGVFAIKQPEFAVANKLFSVYTNGIDTKTDYLFKKGSTWHIGVQASYSTDKIGLKTENDRKELSGLDIGIRSGYRWMFFKSPKDQGFYLNPWLAVVYSFNDYEKIVRGQVYQKKSVSLFPAVHVGWRF